MAGQEPLFSIVIAVRNREKAIVRCLKSVMSQDFQDFEVVLVDGNSTDGTVAAAEAMNDGRIRIVQEPENSGAWGARCLGFEEARGQWAIIFDSDDELTDGALRRMSDRAMAADDDIGVIGASYRDDNGNIHPTPALPDGPYGLTEHLKWANNIVRADYLGAFRKTMLADVEWPPPMGKGTLFEMEIFRKWRKDVSTDICALIHMDVQDRLTGKGGGFSAELYSLHASQSAAVAHDAILRFRSELKAFAPQFYRLLLYQAGTNYLAAGRRWQGMKLLLRYLRRRPLDMRTWASLLCGMIGPRTFIWARRKAS
jgi:glycosyltransferase involved in cell wall biosynthesis